MKAVILAAGLGSRLKPFSHDKPKTLTKVHGKELLARIVDTVLGHNITDFVFTTGHLEEKLKEFMAERYPSLKPVYVRNPDYADTNYIYSMWLAKEAMAGDDILLFHSDVLFEPHLLGRLLAKEGSATLVAETETPAKCLSARIKNGLIIEVDSKLAGDNLYALTPFYKFTQEDFAKWMEASGKFIEAGRVTEYAEHAFNEMFPQFPLHPVYFTEHEICMEIDDLEDLKKGEAHLQKIER